MRKTAPLKKLKLEKVLTLDKSAVKKSFFSEISESVAAGDNEIDIDFSRINQVKAKPENNYQIPVDEVLKQKQVQDIADYFRKIPFVHLKNFPKAKKLFMDFFANGEDIATNIEYLKEQLDKSTSKKDQYGKVIVQFEESGFSPRQFRLLFYRPFIPEVKQYFFLNLEKSAASSEKFQVYTINEKSKKELLVKSIDPRFTRLSKRRNSIEFDAELWKCFNKEAIKADNYSKTIACIERNHLRFEQFVKHVNGRLNKYLNYNITDYIKKPVVRTNNENTSYINFETKTKQKVEFKINKIAVSMQIS